MKIQEIAAIAGVSTATVSRVFGNHPNVSVELRDKVLTAARRNGYAPRLGKSRRNVLVITPHNVLYPSQSYSEMVLSALADEFAEHGCRVELLPQNSLDRLAGIQFCAALAIGFFDEKVIRDWDNHFVAPLIVIDRQVLQNVRNVYSIRCDEQQAMELGIGHLADRGCRKVGALIFGAPGVGNVDERRRCAIAALRRSGLDCAPELVRLAVAENFVEELGKLLNLGIDGLFAPGGNGGIIAAYALALFGKKVPKDISLVTSERSAYSRYCLPPQTTVSQDYPALAAAAADLIERRLAGHPCPTDTVLPLYRIIERDSVIRR